MIVQEVFADVLYFKGTHFDFGVYQAKRIKDSHLMRMRLHQFNARKNTRFQTNEKEAIALLNRYAPKILEEIWGMQEVLELSRLEACRHFSGYFLEIGKSGCSIMTGQHYFARNYDSHPDSYEGRIVNYEPTDGGYHTLGPSMQITGRTDGMNAHGLMVGYNFTNRIHSADGFICNMIARILLETCKNNEEAVALLRDIPHRTSFSYVLQDRNHETLVVEATPKQVVSRQANMCTNHFELLTEQNRYRFDESKDRLNQIKQNWDRNLSQEMSYQRFNDLDHSIFSEKYQAASGTLHTSVYNPEELSLLIGIASQEKPSKIMLHQDSPIRIKRVRGKLNWEKPYPNSY